MNSVEELHCLIYKEWKNGITYAELSRRYKLSTTVVRKICAREENKIALSVTPIYSAINAVSTAECQNVRVYNALTRAGICTREELVKHNEKFYRSLRGIGKDSIAIVLRAIEYCMRVNQLADWTRK